MLKMVIGFDEDKIKSNGQSLDQYYGIVDDMAKEYRLNICADGVYTDNDRDEDLRHFMVMVLFLKNKDWFRMCVKQWDWYEDTDEPENLIERFNIAG